MEPETKLTIRAPKLAIRSPESLSFAPRDLVAVVFRQRKLISYFAAATFVAVLLAIFILGSTYESEMKLLVKRERFDPLVSPSSSTGQMPIRTMTEEEVNSEVDLLQSNDLLQQVVVKAGLDQTPRLMDYVLPKRNLSPEEQEQDHKERIADALQSLNKHLTVEPPNKSNLIRVTYGSKDPEKAAKVLNTLAELYLQKHLAVYSSPGTFEFFRNEAERYRKEMEEAEKKLAEFSREEGIVAAQAEKDDALKQLSAFDTNEQQIRAAMADAQRRIQDLQAQLAITPERITTEVRMPSTRLDQLKQTLFALESKRTELLQKFAPGYRSVKDVEEQIANTRAAISDAERSPLAEPTTNNNPVHDWLKSELAKTRAELAGLQARSAATSRTVGNYRSRALKLGDKGFTQQQLLRAAKLAEENYQLYQKKQEEARITEELDRNRIVNVAIAETATVPGLPTVSPLLKVALGFVLAMMVGVGLGFSKDYLDSTIRTPHELEAYLEVPVLAAIPYREASVRQHKDKHSEPAA